MCDICDIKQTTSLDEIINQAIFFKKTNNIDNILITMSAAGAILINKNQKIKQYDIVKKTIYDVIGAGDVLFASIISNLMKNNTLEKCISIAIKEATSSVEIFGKIRKNKLEIQI